MSVFNLKLAVDVDMVSRWLDMSGLALELWDLSVLILPQGAEEIIKETWGVTQREKQSPHRDSETLTCRGAS